MRVSGLALHMIATSSNLMTNLLDLVGRDLQRRSASWASTPTFGAAWRTSARLSAASTIVSPPTVRAALRAIAEGAFSPELSRGMLDILHAQEFRNGIPARLPSAVRVAHKTGDISTVAHDAGVVYPPGRKPYVVAILTEWAPEAARRSATIAEVSHAVFALLAGVGEPNDG